MKSLYALLCLVGIVTICSNARAEDKPLASSTVNGPSSSSTSLFAQSGRFGVGIGSGTFATGVTGKLYVGGPWAVQGVIGFGYGFGYGRGMNLNIDAVHEMAKLWSNDALSLNWHLGAGGALGFYSGPGVGTGIGLEGLAGL